MSSVEIFVPSDSPLTDEALQALTSQLGDVEIRNVPRTDLAKTLKASGRARKSLSQSICELTLKGVCQGLGGYLAAVGGVAAFTGVGILFGAGAIAAGGALAAFVCTTAL